MIIADAKLNKSDVEAQFSAWLTTQRNANGKYYKHFVANGYARYLRTEPPKLDIKLTLPERDVFRCWTTALFDALIRTFQAAPNFQEVNRTNHGAFSAGLAAYRRYLEFNEKNGETGIPQAQPIARENVEVKSPPTYAAAPLIVDFAHPEYCTGCDPVSCIVEGSDFSGGNWRDVLVSLTEAFLQSKSKAAELYHKSIYPNGERAFLIKDKPKRSARQLSNGYWINVNLSIKDLVFTISKLCEFCCVDFNDMFITYTPKQGEVREKYPELLKSNGRAMQYGGQPTPPKVSVDAETAETIELILSEKYANGFRLDSFIETERLRKFAGKLLGREITLPDEELEQYVKICGTVFEGKVYIVNADTKAKIKELAENYFADGANVIFYEEFYAKYGDWLLKSSVVFEEMLTNILRSAFPRLSFTQTYFGNTNASVFIVLEKEILRVWDDDVLLTYEKLAERLQYIPLARIKYALGQNADFIWNSIAEFTHISKVYITDDEKFSICQFVECEVKAHGYVSIADVPFGDIAESNYELSMTALHNSVYHICLSDKYEQHGKIITPKGVAVDAKYIMDEYCRSLDRCTLDDLLDFEREITGECHRWIPMRAGYDVMVRIDKDNYLADRFLDFDRNAIDNAIEHFINGGEYVALRHITTFAPFPHCGQAWTLFLLESYCRRFSERFRFDVLSVNSTNAGAIVRKHSRLNYHDIMVDAVAKSGIPLNTNAVLEFLATEGYTSQRRYAKVNELITQATAMRG